MSSLVPNVTGHEQCAACIDGWVELAGSETIGGTTYSRGMAPCKWCQLGRKRYEHALDPGKGNRRWLPESNFDGNDIITPSAESRKFTPTTAFLREREAAGIPIDALKAMFPSKIWPPEWPREAAKPPMLGNLDDPKRPETAPRAPIPAEPAPHDAVSGDRTPALAAQHAPIDEDLPF